MADNFYGLLAGKLFGKKDFREKTHAQYGTTISFNIESSAKDIVIGTDIHKNLKVTLFPSFKLKEGTRVPEFIKVGNHISMPGSFFKKAGNKPEDYSLNDKGYRDDHLGKLDFKYLGFDTNPKNITNLSSVVTESLVAGTLCVEVCGATDTKYGKPGTMMLLSESYMVPNVAKDDPQANAKRFRKRYVRAYTPNSYSFAKRQMISFSGQIINHPFIEDDTSPVMYLDNILT